MALVSSKDVPEQNLQCTEMARSGYQIRGYFDKLKVKVVSWYQSLRSTRQVETACKCPTCPACPTCPEAVSCPACPFCPKCPKCSDAVPCPECSNTTPCPACSEPVTCPPCQQCDESPRCPPCDYSDITTLQTQLTLQENEVARLKQDLEQAIESAQRKEAQLRRENQQLSETKIHYEREILEQRQKISYLKEHQNHEEVEQLKQQVQELRQKLKEMEEETKQLREENVQKSEALISGDWKVKQLTLQKQQLEEQMEGWKVREQELGACTEKLKTSEMNVQMQEITINQQKQAIYACQQDVEVEKKIVNQKTDRIVELEKKVQKLNELITTFKEDNTRLEEEKQETMGKYKNCEKETEMQKGIVQRLIDLVLQFMSRDVMSECIEEKEDTTENPSIYDNVLITCLLDKHNNKLIEVEGKPSTTNYVIVVLSTLVVAFLVMAGFMFCTKVDTDTDFMQAYYLVFSNKQRNTFQYPFQLKERQHSPYHRDLPIVSLNNPPYHSEHPY